MHFAKRHVVSNCYIMILYHAISGSVYSQTKSAVYLSDCSLFFVVVVVFVCFFVCLFVFFFCFFFFVVVFSRYIMYEKEDPD